MENSRVENHLRVTKRLILFAAVSLGATGLVMWATFFFGQRLMISWLCLECGIIGGFVSIQQRLNKIGNEELALLSKSWASILLVPVYGGIFALVLYVLFISGLVQGNLFPEMYIPPFGDPPTTEDFRNLLRRGYPSSGEDLAKLMFWSFAAGFSERLVPQIISQVSAAGSKGGGGDNPGGEDSERKP